MQKPYNCVSLTNPQLPHLESPVVTSACFKTLRHCFKQSAFIHVYPFLRSSFLYLFLSRIISLSLNNLCSYFLWYNRDINPLACIWKCLHSACILHAWYFYRTLDSWSVCTRPPGPRAVPTARVSLLGRPEAVCCSSLS